MLTAGAHGQFEIFNVTPSDAYLALRHQTSPHWQLYRLHTTSTGFNLEHLGQHNTFAVAERSAEGDAKTRHITA